MSYNTVIALPTPQLVSSIQTMGHGNLHISDHETDLLAHCYEMVSVWIVIQLKKPAVFLQLDE